MRSFPAMQNLGIEQIGLTVLALAVLVVTLGALAKRVKLPYPIVLVLGGLLLSLVPGIPAVRLNPDLVFYGFLPPLLFSAAFNTSWRDLRRNAVSILLLAFGLVAFTTAGIAVFAHLVIPNLDWRLGLVLGAVVSPTDALAATTIARRLGLPRRVTDILEGESLVNDASGLLALQFAIALAATGHLPTWRHAVGQLALMVFVGVGVGLAIGEIIGVVSRYLDDAPIEITLSMVAPFAAYFAAEALHASGVLASVACGLLLGRQSARYLSSRVRIDAHGVWNTLDFLLNGLVFVLIGLQLPQILAGIRFESHKLLLLDAALVCAALIALRIIWEFPGSYVAYLIRKRLLHHPEKPPRWRQVFVVGWTGMRGVIALAAALSLPATTASGADFPQRSLILFLTFSVILVTLVLQGLTLPPLIRFLGLAGAQTGAEELRARQTAIEAVLAFIAAQRLEDPQFADVYEDLAHRYQRRLQRLEKTGDEEEDLDTQFAYRDIGEKLRKVERRKLLEMRDHGDINDHVLRTLQRELDLLDARYTNAVD